MNVCLFLVNIHRKMSAVSSLLLDILSTKIYFRQIPKNVWLHGYMGVYWCWSFSISPVWSGGSGLLNNGTNLTEFSKLNCPSCGLRAVTILSNVADLREELQERRNVSSDCRWSSHYYQSDQLTREMSKLTWNANKSTDLFTIFIKFVPVKTKSSKY